MAQLLPPRLSTDDDFWIQICNNIFNNIKNTYLQQMLNKVIHRRHCTSEKLHQMRFCK